MNTKLIIGMAAALLMAGTATADNYSRSVVAPSTLDVTGVVVFGVAACENVLGASSPAFCGTGGVSAIIDISGDSTTAGADYVSGSCSVTPSAPGVGADYTFSCGTDRDDDTFVTNNDALPAPGAAGGFDDDYVEGGSNSATTLAINCFRRDLGDVAAPDPQAINNAGADFDDIAVFIATPAGSTTNPFVGFLNVGLSITGATGSCSPDPNGHL